jgi:branched-chain amino acid transport system substrate-binding protein
LMVRAVFQTQGNTSGDALKQALENLDRPYHGVITVHEKPFSITDHDAFSRNMIWLGVWRHGEVEFLNSQDAKMSVVVRRKDQVN